MSPPNSEQILDESAFGDGELTPLEDSQIQAEAAEPIVPAPVYRKQGFSIYTVMLILSFVFLLTAMIFLFIEAGRFQ